MKKLLILLSMLCLLALSVKAQQSILELGLKGGLGFGAAELKDNRWKEEGFQPGLHAGLYTRLNIGPVYLQPEAYYTFTQASLSSSELQVGGEDLQLDFHRLDIPLLLGYHISNHLRLNAGPFASVLIDTNADNEKQSALEKYRDYYERANWGWQAGIGLDVWRLSLDVRYETTIGNLRDHQFEGTSFADYLPDEQKQRQAIVSLGYRISK